MAKKRGRPPGKAKAKSEPVRPSEVDRVINEKQFRALLSTIEANSADKDEAVGRVRSAIARAVAKQFLDKRAFAIFRSLDRLDNSRLATTLQHLEHYCQIGGLNDRIAEQGEMIGRAHELAEIGPDDIQPKKKRGRPKKYGAAALATESDEPVVPLTQREREDSADFDRATTH